MSFFSYLAQLLSEREIHFAGTQDLQTTSILFPEEKKTIATACEQRQQEFATGRWCARQAMAVLELPAQPVLRGQEDEPLWPYGVCGSITHTRGAYCAAVAAHKNIISLGLDIEAQARSISPEAMAVIANEDEMNWLSKMGEDRRQMEKLVFCAKESVFKLLYPIIKKRFSFSAFSVLPPWETGKFALVLNEHLHHDFRPGHRFAGLYFTNSDWMITLSYLLPKHKQLG